jgi:hypothetical protein
MVQPFQRAAIVMILLVGIPSGCGGFREKPDIRLDKDASGVVQAMSFIGRHVSNADLKVLAKHSSVTQVNMQECSKLSDPGFAAIKDALARLTKLELVRIPITDAALANLSGAAQLNDLKLAHTNIHGSGFQSLSGLPIKRLSLVSRHVTQEGMRQIGAMKELEELELDCQDLSLKVIDLGGNLKKLRALDASRMPVGPGGIESLRGLDRLEKLVLHSNDVNDESIDVINTLQELTQAEFANAIITDQGLKRLSLPKLKFLSLDGCRRVTDQGLGNFAGLPSLERLMLGSSGVAGRDLTPLANLPNLKEIILMGNQFRGNDDTIKALQEKLPQCEVSIMRG